MNSTWIRISKFFSFVMVRGQRLLQVLGDPEASIICEGISLRKIIQIY